MELLTILGAVALAIWVIWSLVDRRRYVSEEWPATVGMERLRELRQIEPGREWFLANVDLEEHTVLLKGFRNV